MLYFHIQMTSGMLGYLFHTGASAHNLRQVGELIVPNIAALYPPFYRTYSWDSSAGQFKTDCKAMLRTCTGTSMAGYQRIYFSFSLVICNDLTVDPTVMRQTSNAGIIIVQQHNTSEADQISQIRWDVKNKIDAASTDFSWTSHATSSSHFKKKKKTSLRGWKWCCLNSPSSAVFLAELEWDVAAGFSNLGSASRSKTQKWRITNTESPVFC